MKSSLKNGILGLLLFTLSNVSLASPANDPGEGAVNFSPEQTLNNDQAQHRHWLSIGRVIVGNSHCTGSLIDTRDTHTQSDGPAYVVTAGHCVDSNADHFIRNSSASGEVIFNYFQDTQTRQLKYRIASIAWGTRRGGDIAIIELDRSLKQLMRDGITPLQLAQRPAAIGSDVLIVGAPHFDFLIRAACTQDAPADIFEAGFVWFQQLVNRCEGVRNGISGSPVLTRYHNEILGVIGTTTRISGQSRCAADAPCEITDGLPRKSRNTNYATPVVGLARCFNAGRFDPNDIACPLGPASDFRPRADENYLRVARDKDGKFIPVQWKQHFALDQPFHRIKYTRTLSDCAVGEGYGPPRLTLGSGRNTSTRTLREGPGFYFLCIMGQRHSRAVRSQSAARNARVYWRWALAEPVTIAPAYTLVESAKKIYSITPIEIEPDLIKDFYQFKTTPLQGSDCLNAEGYRSLEPNQTAFVVSVADGSKRVCLKGHDIVGNPTPVTDFQLLDSDEN